MTVTEPGSPPDKGKPDGLLPPWAGVLGSVLAIGGAAAVLAVATQPWADVRAGGVSVGIPGNDVTGGLTTALAIAVLAGWLLGLALRRRGRQVLGLVIAALGVTISGASLLLRSPGAALARERIRTVSLDPDFSVMATFWPQASMTAGTLVMLGGLLLSRTRSAAGRFERGAAKQDLTDWERLDAGDDPTVGSESEPGRE